MSTGRSICSAGDAIDLAAVHAIAPSAASVTTTVSASSARLAAASSTVSLPRQPERLALVDEQRAGAVERGRRDGPRRRASVVVAAGDVRRCCRPGRRRAGRGSRRPPAARAAATSAAEARAPGSIGHHRAVACRTASPPSSASAARAASRSSSTPSSASIARTRSPATSSPSGAATAADKPEPRRADGRDRAAARASAGALRRTAPRRARAATRARRTSGRGRPGWRRRDRSRTAEDNRLGAHATSARIASPVSSALVTKPRAPDSATSGPKSEPSRLDARTIAVARAGLRAAARRPRTRRCPAARRRAAGRPVRARASRRPRTRRRSPCRRRRSRRVSSTTCAIARNDGWSSTINTVTGSRGAIGPIVSPIGPGR